jgi:hypothetical protein
MTVEEFIKEVLSQNERGCIYIDDRCINYSKDRVLSGQWEDIKDCEVLLISAGGGWGLMDYRVTTKKKKKEYPKTYEECCKVLHYAYEQGITMRGVTEEEEELFRCLILLKRCRDAYWKIAGEEMGLGKPWEPDFRGVTTSYVITVESGKFLKSWTTKKQVILTFPTEEMRDAFYENFKELIEHCKELL